MREECSVLVLVGLQKCVLKVVFSKILDCLNGNSVWSRGALRVTLMGGQDELQGSERCIIHKLVRIKSIDKKP